MSSTLTKALELLFVGFGGSKEGIFLVCFKFTAGGGMGRFVPLVISERGCSDA